MEWYEILLLVVGSLFLLAIILGIIISSYLINHFIYPYCRPKNEVIDFLIKCKRFTLKEFNEFKFEEFNIKTDDGLNLKGSYVINENVSKDNKAVILCHGWTSSRYAMLTYAKIYMELGFHIFIYDHRNHHLSDKSITTMGDKEADDLQLVINYVKEKFNYDVVIGTHGESMGAATVMINAGRYHSVSFVVEDCGFDNFYELLVYLQKKERKYLNLTLMFFANIVFKVKTGKFLTDIAPIKYINTCDDIPMLFVHGLKDDFVPTYMAYRCYDFKNGNKKISLYEDCHHGECITNKFNDYKKDVTNFLKENNII